MSQKPVKLIISMIYRDEEFLEQAERELKRFYGFPESLQKKLPFNYTQYYCKEFGRPLKRKLICFKKLLNKDRIFKIKLKTNKIESNLQINGKRTVNIDPGYVTEAKLVLLTTKDYSHRIYLGGHIFAETTLFFKNDTFNPWPWTYPDYASGEMIDYFNKVRKIYINNSRLNSTS